MKKNRCRNCARWIKKVCDENGFSYEVILVDDGSYDNSWKVIEQLSAENNNIKGIKFQRNYGKSAALNEGFKAAQGDVVITMDADLQDSPDEIPGLRNMLLEGGYDLVSGWKKKRYDNTLTKNIPSKFFNAVNRKVSKVPLHDLNSGIKAYRKKVVKSIEVYGEMHRYIPVLAKWAGFKKSAKKWWCTSPQIRRYQVWLGALCQRLSRPGVYNLCRQVFQTAHAFFRLVGNHILYHRPGYYLHWCLIIQNIRSGICAYQPAGFYLALTALSSACNCS
jgi:glycosyltransferase involved in cell wall biosynthesis